ncbi:hypothetical protein PQX77_006212 [Marasmius sp. AFHP31]|nr:hypothetical protein PQX77_006212 [Marasmius sp. AFHP31]
MPRLDDSDPALAYIPPGAWFIGGDSNEYNFTTHGTRNAGAQIQFGTGIDVYGTTPHNNLSAPPVSNQFTLDGGDSVSWSAEPSSIPTYNTNMFGAHGLQDGTHTLVMEVLVRDSETWIDYLEVSRATSSSVTTFTSVSTPSPETVTKTFTLSTEPENRPTTFAAPTVLSEAVTVPESGSSIALDTRSPSTGTSTTSIPQTTASTSRSSAPASTTPPLASDAHSTLSPGTVAGISVGGTLALILALLFLLLCSRRRRINQASANTHPSAIARSRGVVAGIRPFLLWENEPTSSSATIGNPTTNNKRHPHLNGRSHRSSDGEKTYQSNESPPSYAP